MCQPTHSGYSSSPGRVVVCFDLDCFYAQVVEVENPSLKGRPVAIQQKYIVVTCNYEARKLGVTKLGNLEKAKRNVPGLVIVDGSDLTRFRAASEAINRVWESYGCPVERLGMDEVFMDITSFVLPGRRIKPSEDCHSFGDPEIEHAQTLCLLRAGAAFAQEARARLFRELGFTCCAGVSCGKIAAKLAAEMHKPNQQTLLLPSAFSALIGKTEVRKIQGIGRKSRRKLAEKCGGPAPLLCSHVRTLGLKGIRGAIDNDAVSQFIWNAVTGVDTDPVKASGMAKTISVEETSLPHPTSLEAAMTRMNSLASRLFPMIQSRLEQAGDLPKTLRLTIHNAAPPRESAKGVGHPSARRSRYSAKSRSVVLEPEAFRSQAAIFRAATPLLRLLCPPDAALKLSRVNLGASNFSKVSARQVSGVRVMEAFLRRSPSVVGKASRGDGVLTSRGDGVLTSRVSDSTINRCSDYRCMHEILSAKLN